MRINTYRTLVHAQTETVWGLLLDRIENPQNYLHGVEAVSSIDRSGNSIVREITWEGKTVRERITVDKDHWQMTSELIEHPLYNGYTVIHVVPTAVQSPVAPVYLETEINFERKSFHVEQLVKTENEMVADIQKELQAVKVKAEEMERLDTLKPRVHNRPTRENTLW